MAVINYRNSTDDGWISVSGYITEHSIAFFINGNLSVGVHPIRINNFFEYDLVITKLKGYVVTPPEGSGISIDILIDEVSILDDYYFIPIDEHGSLIQDVDGFGTFTKTSNLSIEIIQVGSSVAGADLTFQIGGRAL